MVNVHVWRAAFAFGVMQRIGARRTPPDEIDYPDGFATTTTEHAIVSEWTAGGEIVARKVEALNRIVTWLRPDLAEEAELALAHDREQTAAMKTRVVGELADMIATQDRHNAERRGITPEQYKRERLARDHRQAMKSGVNSRGMR